jgi:hypothetical protein
MGDAPEERAHAEVDHGFGNVTAAFIIADQAAPAPHPAEGSLPHPAAWQDLKALLVLELAHDFDDEVMVGSGARQLAAVVGAVGAVGEQVLQPGPALADGPDALPAPAAPCTSAVVRSAISRRPSVSTAMWRLRPLMRLAAS